MGPPVTAPRSRRRDCLAVEIARPVETKTVPMHQAALAGGICLDEKLRQKGREIMTLDPDSGALIARLRELQLPRYETLSPEEARAAMAASRKAAAVQPPEIFQTQDFEIPINGHAVKARLYRPVASVAPLPMLVFFHGGGWLLADLEPPPLLPRPLRTPPS